MLENVISGAPAKIHPYLFVLIAFWTLTWKGLALWKSSQRKQKYWFVVILIVNTLGILEIIYLWYYFRKEKKAPKGEKDRKRKKLRV